MPNLIITTCGTSLLTNDVTDLALRKALFSYTNTHPNRWGDVPAEHRQLIEPHIEHCRETLQQVSRPEARNRSAELNGLLGFYDENDGRHDADQDMHYLLHTDTWMGGRVAELLADHLRGLNLNTQAQPVPDLNTARLADFQRGIGNLIHWVAQMVPGYREKSWRVVFNLVGGFKSVQGFMQTLGMFYADEILYIFEASRELIRLPSLPVDLDASAFEEVQAHLATLRRLSVGDTLTVADLPDTLPPETFLFRYEEAVDLSPWGRIVFERAKGKLYRQKLQDSPIPAIRFTDRFVKDAEDLSKEQFAQLNERIDDLMRWLVQPDANLKRLDVKKLSGNPTPPSTHEADAWADKDCRRIFLHFEDSGQGRAAVLDRLQEALH